MAKPAAQKNESKANEITDQTGKRYALLIGVNEYEHLSHLSHCIDDVTGIGEVLIKNCDFPKDHVKVIKEKDATQVNIILALDELKNPTIFPDAEMILVYFAGHGFNHGNTNYLAPIESRTQSAIVSQTNLALDKLTELLQESGIEKKIVLVDACRCPIGTEERGHDVGFNRVDALRAANAARGLQIMYGTEFGKVARENSQFQHGLFTNFLIEGLKGKAADENDLITFISLYKYALNRMMSFSRIDTDDTQTPTVLGDGNPEMIIANRGEDYEDGNDDGGERGVLYKTISNLMILAHESYRKKKFEDALTQYMAVKYLEDGAEVWFYIGNCYNFLGLRTEGLEAYDNALLINQEIEVLHTNRGAILASLGRNDEALIAYERSLELAPDYGLAHFNKGNCLASLGKHEEALLAYDDALRFEPTQAEAHNNRGNSLTAMGQYEEAIESYNNALANNLEHTSAHYNKGNRLADLGRHEEAIESFNEALHIDPKRTRTLVNKGNSLADLGRDEEAITVYEEALSIEPEAAFAHLNMGTCLAELGQHDEAEASAKNAMEFSEPDSETNRNAHLLIGMIAGARKEKGNN